jgi:hypothetical protein
MSERAGELLAGWIARTAESGAFPKDEAESRDFADQAISELRIEDVSAAELEAAAGGDLAGHLLAALGRGVDGNRSDTESDH